MTERRVCLQASQKSTMTVNFVPFESGVYECSLMFVDKEVGEFVYKIEGRGLAPVVSETVQWTCKVHSTVKKPIRLPHQNPLREKALHHYITAAMQEKNAAGGAIGVSSRKLPMPSITTTTTTTTIPAEKHEVDRELYQLPKTPLRYKVTYSSPFYEGPSEIAILPLVEQNQRDRRFSMVPFEQRLTELLVNFTPKVSRRP